MVNLSSSSDEEGIITDTSRAEEFARRLFGDLNCDVLGTPDDGKIIILSDSDEEEDEVCEEKCHTPFRERGNEASIRVPRMFKSHV
jgi:hypothetical protein